MAKDQRNFTRGRMNKELDKRLIPNGEYIDALNIGVNSTEEDESGVVENSIGNLQVTALSYNGTSLSNDALCIGALEDGSNETLYWFVHDPSFTPSAATGKLDLIVSYSTELALITYHVVSINDGDGTNTTLNFNPSYLITGVDKVDDFLFFTDDYNAPRFINVTKTYTLPTTVDEFTNEEILVIKKPPTESPILSLSFSGNVTSNFLEDRYICFAYRYRYDDNMYSATSQFTKPAFAPKVFDFSTESYLNDGMENSKNQASVTFNTGGPLVKGIDLLFKEAGNSTIKVIERFDKEDLGMSDDFDESVNFNNSKIFTLLPESEILRLYDNVPRLSKAQTIMGNRLMYGNYLEGYPLTSLNGEPTALDYFTSLTQTDFEVENISPVVRSSSDYDINGLTAVPNSSIEFDLTTVATDLDGNSTLVTGAEIEFVFTFEHSSFNVSPALTPTPAQTNFPSSDPFEFTATFILSQNYASVTDFANSNEFLNSIGTASTINPLYVLVGDTSCDGSTITDQYNCAAQPTLGIYSIYTSGITAATSVTDPEPIKITSGANTITFQFPAFRYVNNTGAPTANVYEYIACTEASASFIQSGNSESLHSNRGYEVGMIYMDEYSRSTNALVSSNNALYVPCANSDNKNKIQVTIPITQLAPSWATRYKFAIKPDREGYDTIYSNLFFVRGAEAYVLLEGENARKVNEGDRLIVKRDGAGATSSCIYVTVLEKLTLSSGQAEAETLNDNAPSGVYIKIDGGDVDFTLASGTFINFSTQECIAKHSNYYAALWQPMNFDSGGAGLDFTVPAGSIIKLRFEFEREGRTETSSCEKRHYTINNTYQSTQDYDNMYEWFIGDDIEGSLNQGVQDQADENNPPTFLVPNVGNFGPVNGNLCYTNINNDSPENYVENITGISPSVSRYGFKWHRQSGTAPQGRLYLVMTSTRACGINKKRWASIKSKVSVTRSLNLMVFETIPKDASSDLFYESSSSYGIDTATGYHYGNAGNQSATDPAIVNTEFFNCYSFGNGVESYRIRDSIEGKTFALGNRATSTQGKDYEEVRRFADITYSGVYNQESNVNKLNEFNLGLLNFKPLEQSYGNISKLHAIQTDVLCLQEDKVSYVLSGKNLLSDAVGGGAVTSVPEVLGQQIARSEDFGISHNPESFAEFGPNIFFTDAKRGAVIQLRGSAAANLNLSVISDAGMSPWFRDLFQVSFDYQKLGGYDPYAEEYVLSSNTRKLPSDTSCIPCGTIQTYVISAGETVTYCVNVGPIAEDFDIDYSFIDGGTADIQAIFNGLPFSTGVTGADGSLTVTKTGSHIQTVDISLVAVDNVTLQVLVNCPVGEELTIVQVCVTSKADEEQLIHNQYKFVQGSYASPLQSYQIQFSNVEATPLVSQFSSKVGFQGEGSFPSDGSTVSVISNKLGDDSYVWGASDELFFLRTNFEYTNTPASVLALLATVYATPLTYNITPIGAASPTVTGTFTMPSTGDYLYLIYDYRDRPRSLSICSFGASKPTASGCCCPTPLASAYLDGPDFTSATGIYTDINLSAQYADGWYSDGIVYRQQVSGVLGVPTTCDICNVDCGTTAIDGTALGSGKYSATYDVGSATGAIVIKYTPNAVPNGIRATYDGTNYNKLTSPVYGKLQSSVPSNNFTVCGDDPSECTGLISTSTFLEYKYNPSTVSWDYQNSSESITIALGDLELQPLSSGQCIMVIPKPAAGPVTVTIDVLATCKPADFSLAVDCPAPIPATTTSAVLVDSATACPAPQGTSHYIVKADGTMGGAPALHAYVFTDANGATAAGNGWIAYVGATYQIQDGIVVAVVNPCP